MRKEIDEYIEKGGIIWAEKGDASSREPVLHTSSDEAVIEELYLHRDEEYASLSKEEFILETTRKALEACQEISQSEKEEILNW